VSDGFEGNKSVSLGLELIEFHTAYASFDIESE
jgi:hypothetical protein